MTRFLPRFTTRELLLLMSLVGIAIAWWSQSSRQPARPRAYPAGAIVIEGPLIVNYRVQTSPTSTSGSNGVPVETLVITNDLVLFDNTQGMGKLLDRSKVVELSWGRKQ